MSFLSENWILVVTAAASGGMLLWQSLQKSGGDRIEPAEAVRRINREKGVLIDVSEPAEFAAAHPVGARNIPFGQVEGSKDLPSNKALPLILTCASGARSGRAVGLLRKAGYENVSSLAGGLAAWREAGLPIDKKAGGSDKPARA